MAKKGNKDKDEINDSDSFIIKDYLLNTIMYQRNEANNYEILVEYFNKVNINKFGDCLYCALSMHYYNNQDNHPKFRKDVYDYLENHKEKYINYFITETNTIDSPDYLNKKIDDYIKGNNKFGKYGVDLKISILCEILNTKIIIITHGFIGYNVYNQCIPDNYNELNNKIIFLLFINGNHYDYFKYNSTIFSNIDEFITNMTKNLIQI